MTPPKRRGNGIEDDNDRELASLRVAAGMRVSIYRTPVGGAALRVDPPGPLRLTARRGSRGCGCGAGAPRRAERDGSCRITWATSRSNGAMPVLASQRPNTRARCTSQAAIYAQAPAREYSSSTRPGRPGAGGCDG